MPIIHRKKTFLLATVIRFVSVFLTVAVLVRVEAQEHLPVLSATDLSDLVEQHEKRLERVQVRYEQISGIVPGGTIDEVLSGSIESVNYRNSGEYAVDFERNTLYFMDDFEPGKGHYMREFASDGKIYSSLSQKEPGVEEYVGDISARKPARLSEEWLLSVGTVGYRIGEDSSLSDLIRRAREITVAQAQIDGYQCYEVTLATTVPNVVLVDGREKIGNRYLFYRLYLNPARGMLPVRIDELKMDKASMAVLAKGGTYFSQNTMTDPRSTICQRDLREVEPGIWFPFEVCAYSMVSSTTPERGHRCTKQSMTMVALNDKAEVKEKIKFMPGIKVKDEIAGVDYIVGRGMDVFDMDVLEVVSEVKDRQNPPESEMNFPDNRNRQEPQRTGSVSKKNNTTTVALVVGILFLIIVIGLLLRKIGRRKSV